jgi:hypothetical protein
MNRTILCVTCALIAPVAFAQTGSTKTSETKTSTPGIGITRTTGGMVNGKVMTFTPGKTIVLKTTEADSASYVLGKTVRYINKAGREIEASMIKPGVAVHVLYEGTGETRVVNRVILDE